MFELQRYAANDPDVEVVWRRLETDAGSSYFLSWAWIETWLACLPEAHRPALAVIRDRNAPVAAYFLGARSALRHGAFRSRGLYLNATGDARCDGLRVEHNGILRAPGSGVTLETMVDLMPGAWDELHLPAVDASAFPELNALTDREDYRVRIDRSVSAPYVDLDLVRAVPGGYASVLSSSMRAQVRRTQRELGDLDIEIAADERHAFEIYDELVRLHARRWHLRGEPGAFGEPFFDQFHRRLIATRLRHGEIQLMRVRAHGKTVGCLYNLVHKDRVLFYQSGIATFDDPHVKPGYLCHAVAVEHNARAGHAVYDLLGGNARFMHSLSTAETRLLWLRVQRRRLQFTVEDRLKDLKHAITSWRQRRLVAGVPSRA